MRAFQSVFTGLILMFGVSAAAAEITPRVVSTAQKKMTFTLTLSEAEAAKVTDQTILKVIRSDRRPIDDRNSSKDLGWETVPYQKNEGKLTISLPVTGEAERTFRLVNPAQTSEPKSKGSVICTVAISALEPDLFALRPYKGDFHTHSARSDGKYTPFQVGAHGRRVGFDFMALTDHRNHAASKEMVSEFSKYQLSYLPVMGEEVHSGGGIVHCPVFGHTSGVHEYINKNPDMYNAAVADAQAQLNDSKLTDYEKYHVAAAQVIYKKARELGGELIICAHPYWRPDHRYNSPPAYTDALFELNLFDAVEVPNGMEYQQMFLGLSRYLDGLKTGRKYNIISTSDTHDAKNKEFGSSYTIVFAPELSVKAIAEAVKNGRSISAHVQNLKDPILIGSDRLARYAYFLNAQYYPEHDEICKKQGELLLNKDGKIDQAALDELNLKLQDLNIKIWGK